MAMCSSLPLLIVLGIQLCISYVLSVYFWRHICSHDSSVETKDKRMKKLIILSCITFAAYFIALHGFFVTGIMHCSGVKDTVWLPAQLISGQYPALTGSLTLVFMFLLRIRYTFIDSLSIFAYSNKVMNSIYFSISLDIFLCLLAGWLLGSGINVESGAVCIMLFMVLYIVNYVVLILMFYKKIYPIMEYKLGVLNGDAGSINTTGVDIKDRAGAATASDDENNNIDNAGGAAGGGQAGGGNAGGASPAGSTDVIIADIGTKSLSNLIKYTVAVILGSISSILCYFVGFLVFAISTSYVEEVATDVTDIAWGIDAITNQFSIIILFGFGDPIYKKYCQWIDNKLKDKFINKIQIKAKQQATQESKIKQQTQEELKSLLFG